MNFFVFLFTFKSYLHFHRNDTFKLQHYCQLQRQGLQLKGQFRFSGQILKILQMSIYLDLTVINLNSKGYRVEIVQSKYSIIITIKKRKTINEHFLINVRGELEMKKILSILSIAICTRDRYGFILHSDKNNSICIYHKHTVDTGYNEH